MQWGGLGAAARRLSEKVQTAVVDVREAVVETADSVKSLSQDAAGSISTKVNDVQTRGITRTLSDVASATERGIDSATTAVGTSMDAAFSWVVGEETASACSCPAAHPPPGGQQQAFRPPQRHVAPAQLPKWEDVRKGDPVFRKGLPAVVVSIDNQDYPPFFVVRMSEADGGHEVGTEGSNLSLGIDVSRQCLRADLRVCMVGLRNRAELNGRRGNILYCQMETNRWNVVLDGDSEPISANPKNMSLLLAGEIPAEVNYVARVRPQAVDKPPASSREDLRQHAAMVLHGACHTGRLRNILQGLATADAQINHEYA